MRFESECFDSRVVGRPYTMYLLERRSAQFSTFGKYLDVHLDRTEKNKRYCSDSSVPKISVCAKELVRNLFYTN